MTARGVRTAWLAAALSTACLLGGCADTAVGAGQAPASSIADAPAEGGAPGAGATDGASFEAAPIRAPEPGHGSQEPTRPGGRPPPPANTPRDVSTVEPFTPQSITLPSGRAVRVRPAGVASDGSLVVPTNPSEAGWWTGGARAGERYGGVVVAGHVDSRRYGIGALAELAQAHRGQQVTLRSGTRALTYQITSLQQVPKATLAAGTGAFRQDISARLVLITCGGAYDAARHSYEDNLIVIATPAA